MKDGSAEITPSTFPRPDASQIRAMKPAAVGKSGVYVVSQKNRSMPVQPHTFFASAGPATGGFASGTSEVSPRCVNEIRLPSTWITPTTPGYPPDALGSEGERGASK